MACYPHARFYLYLLTFRVEDMFIHFFQQTFSECYGAVFVGIRHDDQEFFSAIPDYNVVSPDGIYEKLGDFPQDDISVLMSIYIIDGFKIIYIQHDKGDS